MEAWILPTCSRYKGEGWIDDLDLIILTQRWLSMKYFLKNNLLLLSSKICAFLECTQCNEQILIETNLLFYFWICYPNCCEIFFCSRFEGVPTLGLTTTSRVNLSTLFNKQLGGDQTAVKLDGWLIAISWWRMPLCLQQYI
jgi:hypothetical protein